MHNRGDRPGRFADSPAGLAASGVDVGGEALFLLEALWSPRSHLGVSVNTEGDTSQLYAGLRWGYRF